MLKINYKIISVAFVTLLTGLIFSTARTTYAASNPFTPCQQGYAKFQGTGDCVPESEAQIPTTKCDNGTAVPEDKQGSISGAYQYCLSQGAGGLDYSSIGNLKADCKDTKINKDSCGIVAYLVDFIRILSGLVGVVVVIMITVGGIQYSTARDNPQATAAAKGRIVNAVLALVLYLFIFAFLQWLVPGGVV